MKSRILSFLMILVTTIAFVGCGGGGGTTPVDDGGSGDGDAPTVNSNTEVVDFADEDYIAEHKIKMIGMDTSDNSLKLPAADGKRLSQVGDSTFPYIWIANSGEDTISKLNVETGEELGRYKTGPGENQWYDPSRTTVDQDGNVWVGNRNGKTVTKVGLLEWDQCIDRNGNGVIDTSTGATDVKDWNGTDEDGLGITNAQDECILQHVIMDLNGTVANYIRLVAITPNNNVFVGGSGSNNLFKIDNQTGAIIKVVPTLDNHYGGVVDKYGNLWSMPPSHNGKVQKINNEMNETELIDIGHPGYGVNIDKYGKVWTSSIWDSHFSAFDPSDPVGTLMVFEQNGSSSAQGITTDSNGDVFIAGSLGGSTVGHYRQNFNASGAFNGVTFVANYAVGSGPTGVAVDGKGLVWATNYYDNTASRIDPTTGTVDTYDVGMSPYNYSDMTGNIVRTVTKRQGTWEAIFDAEVADFAWPKVTWALKVALPDDTDIKVYVKVANTEIDLNTQVYAEVQSGVALVGVTGQYLKVKVQLSSDDLVATPEMIWLTVD